MIMHEKNGAEFPVYESWATRMSELMAVQAESIEGGVDSIKAEIQSLILEHPEWWVKYRQERNMK